MLDAVQQRRHFVSRTESVIRVIETWLRAERLKKWLSYTGPWQEICLSNNTHWPQGALLHELNSTYVEADDPYPSRADSKNTWSCPLLHCMPLYRLEGPLLYLLQYGSCFDDAAFLYKCEVDVDDRTLLAVIFMLYSSYAVWLQNSLTWLKARER